MSEAPKTAIKDGITSLIDIGNQYYREGDLAAALKSYEQALRLRTESGEINSCLARCYNKQGNFNTALHFAESAVDGNPNYAYGFLMRGVVLNNLGRIEEATRAYGMALRRRPDIEKERGVSLRDYLEKSGLEPQEIDELQQEVLIKGSGRPGRSEKRRGKDYCDAYYYPEEHKSLSSNDLFFEIADGVGGGETIKIEGNYNTAEYAVAAVAATYEKQPIHSSPGEDLERSIREASKKINEKRGVIRTATTLTAVVISGGLPEKDGSRKLTIAQVGDVLAYIVPGKGPIRRLIGPQMWYEEEIKRLMKTYGSREKAEKELERRHEDELEKIKKAPEVLGKPVVNVRRFEDRVRPGDAVVLASDGLWGVVDEEEIERAVRGSRFPREAVGRLQGLVDSRERFDDSTVIVCYVN